MTELTVTSADLRCSVQTQGRGVDPIGTATTYDAYVLVEVPLPWPASITDHADLAAVVAAVETTGVRANVLGLVPDHDDVEQRRVVVYGRPPGPFRAFRRLERVVPVADLGPTAATLVAASVDPGSEIADDDGPTHDLLVCTHGRRDRCCGSFGTNLFTAVGARHLRAGVRTWRVSHTGGHRFAPTAIVLPEGHLWAWLDGDLVDAVLHRRGDLDDLLEHYRGSSAMGPAPVQVAEREAFRREGWSWLDATRAGSVVDQQGDLAEVRIDAERTDGTRATYTATVERTGTVPQPVCGEPPTGEGNGKSDSIWVLTRFDAVDP